MNTLFFSSELWESKVLQSKAVEGFAKENINPSNFILQLPTNYSQTLQKSTGQLKEFKLFYFTARCIKLLLDSDWSECDRFIFLHMI